MRKTRKTRKMRKRGMEHVGTTRHGGAAEETANTATQQHDQHFGHPADRP